MLSFLSARSARPAHTRSLRARQALAWLCVMLVLVTGCIHLLHSHGSGVEAANASCGLCAVAHLSVMPVPAVAAPVLRQPLVFMPAAATHAPPARPVYPALYVRPPPVYANLPFAA